MSYAPNNAMTPIAPGSQGPPRTSSVHSRHSSTGPVSHQSFFVQAPVSAGVPKDPRPLNNGGYRAKIGQELLDYLTQNNFELEMKWSLSQKAISNPAQKDFDLMFQWLYNRIDPSYYFIRKMETEVPEILKTLRYPYQNQFTKSQFSAVGGQNWSKFLGMLHWLMQLAQMLDKYNAGEYDDACAEAGVDVSGDRIIFRFLSGAYREWLQVEDEDEDDAEKLLVPHVEAMAVEFERGNQRYAEEMKILEAENTALKQRIEEAEKGAPDLAKLEKHFEILRNDSRKFEEYNKNTEGKNEKNERRIQFLKEEIERTDQELEEAEKEKAALQSSVDKQGITIQDIDEMNNERERLQKAFEATVIKLEDVKRKALDKETDASRTLEDLERAVDNYNSLCYQIGLVPSTAAAAKGENFDLELVNVIKSFSASTSQGGHRGGTRLLVDSTTGYQPAHILNLDLRGRVKGRLVALKKEISDRRTQAMDADMKNHELLDSIKEAIDDRRSEVEALQHRVWAAEEEFNKTKEVSKPFLSLPSLPSPSTHPSN